MRHRHLPLRVLHLASTLLAGCLPSTSLPPPRDAGVDATAPPVAPEVQDVTVVDADGVSYERDAIPLRPFFALRFTAPLGGDPEPIVLLRGELDGALLDDLEAPPLRVSTRERIIATRIERNALQALVQPDAPLAPGASYVLAVGGWAGEELTLGLAFAVALKVADHGGGARLVDSWPADGTQGVPRTVPFLAIRFDEPVRGLLGGVHLLDDVSGVVPTTLRPVSCVELGWAEGECLRIEPVEALWAGRNHRIEITEEVLDRGGSPVGPALVHFRTALGEPVPPQLHAPACALDEEPWPQPNPEADAEAHTAQACVLADDHRLRLRLAATGPLRYALSSEHDTATAVAARGDAALELTNLSPDTEYALTLRTRDLNGRAQSVSLTLRTTPTLDQVYISEVRADPVGAEPSQEYVELWNAGARTVDLEGYALSDSPLREGDIFTAAGLLGPGERVLVVADGFDPADPRDAMAPPGARLVRIGTSLGSGGLSNAGEPLYLRDALGHRLSGAPAMRSAGPGVCLLRIAADGRRADAAAFEFVGTCTPGGAAR